MPAVQTKNLTKKYGDSYAITNINLSLEKGDLFGFIGPNGAGKTTTMRIIATLLQPTSGEAYVDGHSIYTEPKEIRRLVGYMPDFFGVYEDMKVIEYLEFFASAYRIDGERRRKICEEKLEQVNLAFKRDAFANTLSRGQTQRLGLARTLLHDPQLLLLDEPLSGLDPRARIGMRNVLRELGRMGKTIIVSSHILPELEDICNKFGIIDEGVMSVNATADEVMRTARKQIVLHVALREETERAGDLLRADESVERVEPRDGRLIVTLREGIADYTHLPNLLIAAELKLKLFQEEEVSLEEAFMTLTKGRVTEDKER